MFHDGFRVSPIEACVNTVSPGRRLTRPAPPRIALRLADEIPLRLLTTLPESLIESGSLNRRGGAKSRAVNVPDLRRRCLRLMLVTIRRILSGGFTYGLGKAGVSSKALTNGEWIGVFKA